MRTAPAARRELHIPSSETPTQAWKWSWPYFLALCGIPILLVEVWSVGAWLLDGPEVITAFRDPHSASWHAARVAEVIVVLVALGGLIYVIRGCRQERKVLTFDAMFCLVGATLFWTDMGGNFFLPSIMQSTNLVAFHSVCGHIPLVVNPDCGQAADAIPLWWLMETFGVLVMAVVLTKLVQAARGRWPGISNLKLAGLVLLITAGLYCLIEPPAIALGLWNYTLGPAIHLGPGLRLPFIEIFCGVVSTALWIVPRVFRDDRGRTFLERGLERHTPRRQKAITLMALYGYLQIVIWGLAVAPFWPASFYEPAWPEMPRHLLNNVCDAPGVTGTRYGPCPGSPGFRMPGRNADLPGEAP
jgi:hypothetical protein